MSDRMASSPEQTPDTRWLLSDVELVRLTGYRLSSAQRRWLDRHGLRYVLDAAGRPRVAREAVDRLLGVLHHADVEPDGAAVSSAEGRVAARPRVEPNFAALLAESPRVTSTGWSVRRRPAKRRGDQHGS